MYNSSNHGQLFCCYPLYCIEHLILERAKDLRNTLENASGDTTVLLNKLGNIYYDLVQSSLSFLLLTMHVFRNHL
jgi:hypothetical protein